MKIIKFVWGCYAVAVAFGLFVAVALFGPLYTWLGVIALLLAINIVLALEAARLLRAIWGTLNARLPKAGP
jgi:hypothetical protein